ncbi:hypothetical protein ACILDU_11165, partial [Capnocytophaga canimorsus]
QSGDVKNKALWGTPLNYAVFLLASTLPRSRAGKVVAKQKYSDVCVRDCNGYIASKDYYKKRGVKGFIKRPLKPYFLFNRLE